jgi:osmotically-inducible protein OsmY
MANGRTRRLRHLALALAAGMTLAGCAPMLIGGAMVGGAIVVSDRRPVGIQLEDQAIEGRINRALGAHFGKLPVNINVTSYNRKVLLLGQVPDEPAREQAVRIADRAENVRLVMNELVVGPVSSLGARTNDTAVSGKVRGALLEAKHVQSGTIAVTTEGGVVYLLGRVTEAEGDAAARVASRVSGVQRVVKAFDYLTAEELAAMRRTSSAPESARK